MQKSNKKKLINFTFYCNKNIYLSLLAYNSNKIIIFQPLDSNQVLNKLRVSFSYTVWQNWDFGNVLMID